ncbi:MAG: hypothetical protein A3K67_06955 [Euryarchaeota archaeon RBG_16_62_10]|nr:MAG: hypothetical protein A3K67_06955 [Euryarchaeota archaeon RBG_16_62_10]
MALRVLGSKCWIMTKSGKDGSGNASYMYCQSKIRGLGCPLEGKPGKKPFELGSDCFEEVKKAAQGPPRGKK